MKRLMLGLISLPFLAMAWLQLNDPDPLYWVAVYTVVALTPLAAAMARPSVGLWFVAAGMTVSGLLISAPGFLDYLISGDYASVFGAMRDDKPYVEAAREFIGLLFALIGLAVSWRSTASG